MCVCVYGIRTFICTIESGSDMVSDVRLNLGHLMFATVPLTRRALSIPTPSKININSTWDIANTMMAKREKRPESVKE